MAEGKKNYAKSERVITICTCKGMPPEDVTCEYCPQERRKDGNCLFSTNISNDITHCGCYEAQVEARK